MSSYTYSAFISYRHLPVDMAAAKAVQRALETYRIPGDVREKTGQKKLNRCFRDQDELPLADDLGASIEKALRESEWLIVICTPDLPASRWCCREVDYFIELGRRDRIIPVLVSGEPKDSYPPQITRADSAPDSEEVEPLAADLRGNLRKQLRSEKLRIAARMLNLNYNDLRKREKERALRRGLVIVSCVLCAVIAFAAYALHQNSLLAEERNATARNAAELLVEKSVRSTGENDYGSGLVYALQAYEGSRLFGTEFDASVTAALEAAIYPDLYTQIGTLKDHGIIHATATLTNDGSLIACTQSDNSLTVYNSVTGEKLFSFSEFGWYRRTALTPDSKYLCRFTEGETVVTLYGIRDGKEVLSEKIPEGWTVSASRLTLNNSVPLTRTGGGAAALYNLFSRELVILDGVTSRGESFEEIVMHRSGTRGAWADGEKIWLVDTENGKVLRTVEGSLFDIFNSVTDEGLYFRYIAGDAYVYLRWDTLEEVLRSEYCGVLSPDGKLLAETNGYSGFTVRSVSSGESLLSTGFNSGNTVYHVEFADNDTLIASHQQVQIYRISDGELLYNSGEDRTTYGFDMAAGRLVMPLRAGGCLVNLLPEENDLLPHRTVETRENFNPEDLVTASAYCPLAGFWDGSTFYFEKDGEWVTPILDEPGLLYIFDGEEYLLKPVRGAGSAVFVSPDGKWQAMIRGEEVDIFRAKESPEPVMTIPGNGYQRLWACLYGKYLALSSYVENLVIYDLETGECLGTVGTGAMCPKIEFSTDGRHLIAFSGMSEQVSVINMENMAVIMRIPVKDAVSVYNTLSVGFNRDGTEAIVLYPDGHADVGLLYRDMDTLVEKARKYTTAAE